MLTPLFRHLGINLSEFEEVKKRVPMNITYLAQSLSGQGTNLETGYYMHNVKIGNFLYMCQLPQLGVMDPTTKYNITFDLLPHLYTLAPLSRGTGQPADPRIHRMHHKSGHNRYPRPPRENEYEEVDPNEEIDALGDEPPLPPQPWTDREERFCELHMYQSSVIDIFYRAFKSVKQKMRHISSEMVGMPNEMSCIRKAVKDAGRNPPSQSARSGKAGPSNQPAHSRAASSVRSGLNSQGRPRLPRRVRDYESGPEDDSDAQALQQIKTGKAPASEESEEEEEADATDSSTS